MLANASTGLSGMLALFSGGIGSWEVVVILVALLLLFGGKKLPDLARGLGKGLRGFKEELHGVRNEIEAPPALDEDRRRKRKRKRKKLENTEARDEAPASVSEPEPQESNHQA